MTPIFQFLGGSSSWKIASGLSILLLLLSLTMSHWPWMKEIPNVLKLMFSLHCCHKWVGFQTEIIQGKLLSEQNHILQEKCHATIYLSDQCIGVLEMKFITKKYDVSLTDTAARILLRNVAWSTQSNYLSERPLKEWNSLLKLNYKTNIHSIESLLLAIMYKSYCQIILIVCVRIHRYLLICLPQILWQHIYLLIYNIL